MKPKFVGHRHNATCLCGCHWIEGQPGKLVESAAGIDIYEFRTDLGKLVKVAYESGGGK